MKKTLSYIGSISVIVWLIHFFLNLYYLEEYTSEETIKILRSLFTYPVYYLIISGLIIVLIISVIGYKKKQKPIKTSNNLTRNKKIVEIKNQFLNKAFKNFKTPQDYLSNPIYQINPNFHKINLQDVNNSENSFPYETFDFKEDGIEFLSGENIQGYNLLFDERGKWDVLEKSEAPKKGSYKKPQLSYSICFLAYEDILNIDWEHDLYNGNITIVCDFKYLNYNPHPFKEFRYYLEAAWGFTKLDINDRRSFAKYKYLKPVKIYFFRLRKKLL